MGKTMAEPRRSPKAKAAQPKAAPKPEYENVNFKASGAWKQWLNRLADHCRMDVSTAIDKALVAMAKAEGFDEPAPPRKPRRG